MARSSAQEAGKPSARKRQLNLIYFVDSARTNSLALPLGRLKLLGVMLFVLVAWSIGSTVLVISLHEGRADLTQRLEASLATIFEYESRYDHVYEKAYPAEGRKAAQPKTVAMLPPQPDAPPAALMTGPAAAGAVPSSAAEPAIRAAEPALNAAESAPKAAEPAPKVVLAASAAKAGDKPSEAATDKAKELDSLISVTNPVLEPKDGQLELRFDLTNKSSKERAEGYLWAVAEFKTADGQTLYFGAPSGIEVGESGEPRHPQRSASFGIKHFKKKSFSFPYAKDRPGTFTGIRIGVMDKTGSDRTTYNVPVEIRVPKGS
jgi:hypothetical protein